MFDYSDNFKIDLGLTSGVEFNFCILAKQKQHEDLKSVRLNILNPNTGKLL